MPTMKRRRALESTSNPPRILESQNVLTSALVVACAQKNGKVLRDLAAAQEGTANALKLTQALERMLQSTAANQNSGFGARLAH